MSILPLFTVAIRAAAKRLTKVSSTPLVEADAEGLVFTDGSMELPEISSEFSGGSRGRQEYTLAREGVVSNCELAKAICAINGWAGGTSPDPRCLEGVADKPGRIKQFIRRCFG